MNPPPPLSPRNPLNPRVRDWFKSHDWKPFDFQQDTWSAYAAGHDGLVHAPTGTGKTYAVWLGPVMQWMDEHSNATLDSPAPPLTVLWITPLRALALDTAGALERPIRELGLPWTVQLRTGDTSSSQKLKQRQKLPTALVTTPESLTLLLTYPHLRQQFEHLRCVIVDEWHELMSTKRGVQTELALARLRRWAPNVRTWGLSATLANLDEAMRVLLGPQRAPQGKLIRSRIPRTAAIDTLIPREMERFPWAGHLGLRLLPDVIHELEAARTALLFTNTRSQSEIWFQALLRAKPDWLGQIALHHGSLDGDVRREVEAMLREGSVRCVVCTSSLDLGVDFAPVDVVFQVGSPKGVARLIQRAGRSGHTPTGTSRIVCVPTNALELVEFAAVREAVDHGQIEARPPLRIPLDLLVQHLVSIGLGGGFTDAELLDEIRQTHAFAELTDEQFNWVIEFVSQGGAALSAYAQHRRLTRVEQRWAVTDPLITRLHRLSVGTIMSESSVRVQLQKGKVLGQIEESFIARLRPGDRFVFAGQWLELIRAQNLVATVKKAPPGRGTVPKWMGARMPMSSSLARAVLDRLERAASGAFNGREMKAVAPILKLQKAWSQLPRPGKLVIEHAQVDGAWHVFIYTLAGRLAHEGLAAVVAHRLAQEQPRTLTVAMNDYGFTIVSSTPLRPSEAHWRKLLSTEGLLEDILSAVNTAGLARSKFREIARVAGLVFPGFPGAGKTARQLQASSDLFFDVFREFDPGNLLLEQARREAMEQQLEFTRLREVLEQVARMELICVDVPRLTPLGFSLWADQLMAQVSSESWADKVKRMTMELESAAR